MGWTFWKEKSITFLLAAFVQSAFLHPFFHSFRCECHSLQLYLKAVTASPYAFEMHSIAPPFLSFRWFCKLRKMRSVWMQGIQQISQRTICAHSCQITKRNMKCKRNECTLHMHTLKASKHSLYTFDVKSPAMNRNHIPLCHRDKHERRMRAHRRLYQLKKT